MLTLKTSYNSLFRRIARLCPLETSSPIAQTVNRLQHWSKVQVYKALQRNFRLSTNTLYAYYLSVTFLFHCILNSDSDALKIGKHFTVETRIHLSPSFHLRLQPWFTLSLLFFCMSLNLISLCFNNLPYNRGYLMHELSENS